MMIFYKMSTYIPVIFFFCRPEIVPEISLEELEEPLLSASSTNDSAIAVESEVRKLEICISKKVSGRNHEKN